MRSFVLVALFLLGSVASSFAAAATKPNIIFILSDDLAQGDVGAYGQKLIQTPRLDRMAREGTRYTQAYCGTSVCAPSRTSLMTGLHSGHAPVRGNWEVPVEGQLPLPASTVTVAQVLKSAGYATAVAGKWGMGMFDTTGNPLKKGFDHQFGYNCQRHAHSYFPTYLYRDGKRFDLPGNDGVGVGTIFAQQLIQEDVLKWVRSKKEQPFFLYYAITLPHGRHQFYVCGPPAMMETLVPTGRANYEPNSLAEAGEDGGPRACPDTGFTSFRENAERNDPTEKLRVRAESFADHYSQARMFYRSQTENEQAHIASALVFELSKVLIPHIPPSVIARLRNIDEDLAQRVADGLGIELPEKAPAAKEPVDLGTSDALSIQKRAKPTFKGRKIGILFDEGSNKAMIDTLVADIAKEGGTAFLVAPKIGPLKVKGGTLKADGQLAGSPSVLFDAVVAILMPERAEKLAGDVGAVAWFADAWYHCKTIGACGGTRQHLLPKANIEPDDGVVDPEDFMGVGPIRHWHREPEVRDLA